MLWKHLFPLSSQSQILLILSELSPGNQAQTMQQDEMQSWKLIDQEFQMREATLLVYLNIAFLNEGKFLNKILVMAECFHVFINASRGGGEFKEVNNTWL